MAKLDKNLLLFDGVCNLCNGVVRFIIKLDTKNKFKFGSIQSGVGRFWLERYGLLENEIDSFVFIHNNKFYRKSTAALKMARELGGIGKILYVFILLPRPLRDSIYDIIARYRYKIFGKRDNCMIPGPELQARFL
jgi:predicted DCC family thiol-disulfide oxidoreductase YuxK